MILDFKFSFNGEAYIMPRVVPATLNTVKTYILGSVFYVETTIITNSINEVYTTLIFI